MDADVAASMDLFLGPVLLGNLFNMFLYGIMVLQCYIYFLNQKGTGDKWYLKALVGFLLLADTVSTAFDITMAYLYLVQDYGNFTALSLVNIGAASFPATTAITAFTVQCFYSWRIAVLTNQKLCVVVICILATASLLGGIGSSIGGAMVGELERLSELKAISLVWSFCSVAADIVIAIILVSFLWRRRTGHAVTNGVISRVILVTVQTGILTTAICIACVIIYLTSTSTLWFIFGLPLSKLYTNSLLSTLNARSSWGGIDLSLMDRSRGPSGPSNRWTYTSHGASNIPPIRMGPLTPRENTSFGESGSPESKGIEVKTEMFISQDGMDDYA